uniref:Uncharacterized protein n=1 Tax=Mandrillus leucophaeus TaxID=9568 RepID=A0A2K5XDY8_MANLE
MVQGKLILYFPFLILSIVSKSDVEFFCRGNYGPRFSLTAIKIYKIKLFCIKGFSNIIWFSTMQGVGLSVLKHLCFLMLP